MDLKTAREIAIGLSEPSKMPCCGYSIPASRCSTGSKLRKIEGSVCFNCYAFKGNYGFKNVKSALERRYQALSNPLWIEAMVTLIRETNHGDTGFFRWHDSGDLQGEQHLSAICEIARRLPEVKFWLPTKEWKLVRDYFKTSARPENLTIRLSMPNVDQQAPVKPENPEFVYSEVYSKGNAPTNGVRLCPAKNQGNKCLDCRACWDKSNLTIAYPNH